MRPDPTTKQRSAWESFDGPTGLEPDARWWRRNVHDGQLRACVGTIPGEGLHMSISHAFARSVRSGEPQGRYPTWDEILHARQTLLPPDVGFVMHLPPENEYISVHHTTFHLHEDLPPYVVRMGGKVWEVHLLLNEQNGEPWTTPDGKNPIAALLLKDMPANTLD